MKLYGIGSGRTTSGINRIARILLPDITMDIAKKGVPAPDPKLYDGVLCHNVISDPFNRKLPRIVFLASGKTAHVATMPRLTETLKASHPDAVWVNQDMGRELFAKVGIEATTMYRPNRLEVPAVPAPIPKGRKILWHMWTPGPWMPPDLQAEIIAAMKELSDVEIRIIGPMRGKEDLRPNGKGLDHVIGGGWFDLRTEAVDYHGVVRVYNVPCGLDLGRSTFQVLAFGRWYICRKTREPVIDSVDSVAQIPAMVRKLIDNDTERLARKKWKYIKNNFTEEILHERWVAAVKGVING